MKISDKGLTFLKNNETIGGVPNLLPYQCSAGKWTIGFGCTYYPNGKPVTEHDIPLTSADEAEILLYRILIAFEEAINKAVVTNINQNQYDALVSFVFNIGIPSFKASTLLKRINVDRNDERIKYEFSRWNKEQKGFTKNGKPIFKENAGLTARRKRESDLYFSIHV